VFWRAPKLHRLGVLGINRRNADYVMRYNQRKYYPFADDKLRTKSIAIAAGIAVPDLYGVIETQRDIRNLPQIIDGRQGFVIKPACGSGGNGVLVLSRRGETFRRPDGRVVGHEEMAHHTSNVLSGQYSLGGQPDRAMIEYRVRFTHGRVERIQRWEGFGAERPRRLSSLEAAAPRPRPLVPDVLGRPITVDELIAHAPEKLELVNGRIARDKGLLLLILTRLGVRRAAALVGHEVWKKGLE